MSRPGGRATTSLTVVERFSLLSGRGKKCRNERRHFSNESLVKLAHTLSFGVGQTARFLQTNFVLLTLSHSTKKFLLAQIAIENLIKRAVN